MHYVNFVATGAHEKHILLEYSSSSKGEGPGEGRGRGVATSFKIGNGGILNDLAHSVRKGRHVSIHIANL